MLCHKKLPLFSSNLFLQLSTIGNLLLEVIIDKLKSNIQNKNKSNSMVFAFESIYNASF